MNQDFDASSRTFVARDAEDQVRSLLHMQSGKPPEAPPQARLEPERLARIAAEYLRSVAHIYELEADALASADESIADEPVWTDAGMQLGLVGSKTTMDISTVELQQTFHGIPVWQGGAAVQIKTPSGVVLSSQFTGLRRLRLAPHERKALDELRQIEPPELARLLNLASLEQRLQSGRLLEPRIVQRKPWIFRHSRAHPLVPPPLPDELGQPAPGRPRPLLPHKPRLLLPEISAELQEGQDYLVVRVLFVLNIEGWGELPWSALIEPTTRSVLKLDALVDGVGALVFPDDPVTLCRCTTIGPQSTAQELDPLRQPVTLQGLRPPDASGQALVGEYVRLEDCYAPVMSPPTQAPGVDFEFSSRTNEFAAVSAYYHCDAFFRLLAELGFDIPTYFDGTTFPIPVDHRASCDIDAVFGGLSDNDGNQVNAQSLGNARANGQGALLFLLADIHDLSQPLGAAVDRRVVLHEMGHTLLWDHVNKPNFGFCHSAGDSLAAILGDVAGPAPDPWETIPFTHQGLHDAQKRRHDRRVNHGWAWGGVHDDCGYESEQILSTTLFRFYQAIGGAHPALERRELAARFSVYLIVRAIGTLTPATNARTAVDFANALMVVDAGDWTAHQHAGGAYHKVIRWAFEQQGLYQPSWLPGPYTVSGGPPAVDVFIEDGRAGAYEWIADDVEAPDVWNESTGGAATGVHEAAHREQPNFAYVRIQNRGTETAANVRVRGYQCRASADAAFPADWAPLDTPELTAPELLTGGAQVVGPFQWTPTGSGDTVLLFSVSAAGDPSNIDGRVVGPIPNWRLIPHDNNLAQRRVSVVSTP